MMNEQVSEEQKTSKSARRRQKNQDKKILQDTGAAGTVTPLSGFVGVLKRALQDLEVQVRPSRTYYVVDFFSISELFTSFDSFIRLQPRRGGWKHPGFYAGAFWFAFAAKLQRIGVGTEQIPTAGVDLLQVANMQLPAVIQMMIDQFGVKMTVDKVEMMPLVTTNLLCLLQSYALRLMDNADPDYAAAVITDSSKEMFRRFISRDWFDCFTASLLAEDLGVSYTKNDDYRVADSKMAFFSIVANRRHRDGDANLTTAQVGALLPAGNARSPISAYFDIGAGAPGVGGVITARINQAIGTVYADWVTGNNPWANAGPPANLNGLTSVPCGSVNWQNEQYQLSVRFPMKNVSVNVDGSLAPLVRGYDDQGLATAESVVRGLTPVEWTVGSVLGQRPFLCGDNLVLFNVGTKNRRVSRNSIGHMYTSIDDLRAAVWREGMK